MGRNKIQKSVMEREELNNADMEIIEKPIKIKKATAKTVLLKQDKFLELLQDLPRGNEVKKFQLENQLQEVMNLLIELLSTFMKANDTIAQIGIADEKEIKNDEYSNNIDQAEGY